MEVHKSRKTVLFLTTLFPEVIQRQFRTITVIPKSCYTQINKLSLNQRIIRKSRIILSTFWGIFILKTKTLFDDLPCIIFDIDVYYLLIRATGSIVQPKNLFGKRIEVVGF